MVTTLERESLVERCSYLSDKIMSEFNSALGSIEGVREIRGKGLMLGIRLDRPCTELVGRGLDAGILINVTADDIVRLLPPLIMSDEEAAHMVSTVCSLIEAFCRAD